MERAFVVQFSTACSSTDSFIGKVEHVQSGQAAHFTTIEEFLTFVLERLEAEQQTERSGTSEHPNY